MAKLNIGATDIVASILNSTMRFSAEGLEVGNGDFRIYNPDCYRKIQLDETQYNTDYNNGKYYYHLDANNSYVLADKTYDSEIQYFEKYNENVLYADGDTGALTLKGNIYANSGVFRGDVFANNGTFNGTITATDGSIGGFKIYSNYF
jgi:hypothetical protein